MGSHEGGAVPPATTAMDKSVRPYRRIKCARKGCGKCLFCLKISAVCQCSPEEKKKEPRDVMYGWCVKCRSKHAEDYKKVVGVQCTYCGADTEDNFTPCGIAIAIFLLSNRSMHLLLLEGEEMRCVRSCCNWMSFLRKSKWICQFEILYFSTDNRPKAE